MKLIKKLGRRIYAGRLESFGIFWCEGCEQEVEKTLSHGLRDKSCGCNRYEFIKGNKYNLKHGEGNGSRLYYIWGDIKQRILNFNNQAYKYYGGRGITICNEWLEFIPFRDWALSNGYAEGLVIDRRNPDGNYEPSNCRFLTILESNRNKTNTTTMEIVNGVRELWNTGKYTQKQLAEMFNLHKATISAIIRNKQWKN